MVLITDEFSTSAKFRGNIEIPQQREIPWHAAAAAAAAAAATPAAAAAVAAATTTTAAAAVCTCSSKARRHAGLY